MPELLADSVSGRELAAAGVPEDVALAAEVDASTVVPVLRRCVRSMSGRWLEVANGVYARRYVELDQTLGLVVGDTHCLVIDTGTDEVHGASMAAAVRFVTPLPWTVVITHAHFDHFFGTAAFLPASVIAHERCRSAILADGEHAAAGRGRRATGRRARPSRPTGSRRRSWSRRPR